VSECSVIKQLGSQNILSVLEHTGSIAICVGGRGRPLSFCGQVRNDCMATLAAARNKGDP